MYSMSLYESKKSMGKVSIMDMKNGKFKNDIKYNKKVIRIKCFC